MQVVTNNNLTPEFRQLHDAVYGKVMSIIQGHQAIDLKNDPSLLVSIFQSAMEIVERAKTSSNKPYTGPEKKQLVIGLIQTIISDLAKNKIIPIDVANTVNGIVATIAPVAIDLAVAAANRVFDIGQKFVQDVKKDGCKATCKKACCCCITQ